MKGYKNKTNRCLGGLLVLCCLALRAQGVLLVYEGFDYASDTLAGANGGIGWNTSWKANAELTEESQAWILGNSLVPPEGYGQAMEGGCALLEMPAGQPSAYRGLAAESSIDMNSVSTFYISFLAERSNTSSRAFSVWLKEASGSDVLSAAVSTGGAVTLTLGTNSVSSPNIIGTGQPHLFVMKIESFEDSPDHVYICSYRTSRDFIPVKEPDVWKLSVSAEVGSVASVFGLRGGLNRSIQFDEVRIGTSWESVIPSARMNRMRRQAAWRQRRLIYNDDGQDWPLEGAVTSENVLGKRISPLAGTHVDSIFYCTGVTRHYTHRSNTAERYTYNPSAGAYASWVQELHDQDTDPLELVVDFGKKQGIEVFWSLRMNDIHDRNQDHLMTDWKRNHPHLMMAPEPKNFPYGYWSSLNFERREVHDALLDDIRDVLDNYDVDGIELSFVRNTGYFYSKITGFPVTQAENDIMTGFLQRVRNLTEEFSFKRKSPVLLAVHVLDSIGANKEIGLDLIQWMEDGLIDILVAGSPEWQMEPWRNIVSAGHAHGVPVYPCMSYRFPGGVEVWRGESLIAWDEGADGIYLFNCYFQVGHEGSAETTPLFAEAGDPSLLRQMPCTMSSSPPFTSSRIRRISSLRTAFKNAMDYLDPEVGRRVPYYMFYSGCVIRVPEQISSVAGAVHLALADEDISEVWIRSDHVEEIEPFEVFGSLTLRSVDFKFERREQGAVLWSRRKGPVIRVRPDGELTLDGIFLESSAGAESACLLVEGAAAAGNTVFVSGAPGRSFQGMLFSLTGRNGNGLKSAFVEQAAVISLSGAGSKIHLSESVVSQNETAPLLDVSGGSVRSKNTLFTGSNTGLLTAIRSGPGCDLRVIHSTIYLHGGTAVDGAGGKVDIQNSIVAFADGASNSVALDASGAEISSRYNLIHAVVPYRGTVGEKQGDITEREPCFISLLPKNKEDFYLSKESPARQAASRDVFPPIPRDLAGFFRTVYPSMGCYE